MNDCIFCKIVNGEIPCEKIYEDDKIIAFNDINPEAPVHVLIIPKEHISMINDLNEENAGVVSHIFIKAKEIAEQLKIADTGYRIVTNCGIDGGQTVFHIHYHLLGGRELQWPPG